MREGTFAALVLAVAAGTASPAWPAEPAPQRFRLDLLTADWRDLERVQEWESAWPRLKDAAGNVFFSLGERDVAAYDWEAQRIVLRPEASLRLLAAAQKLPDMPERLYKLRALWSTDDLTDIVLPRGFVVSLDGRQLYGGFFLSKASNLSMPFPVIHSAMDDSRRIVLRFSPVQFTFGSLWDNGTGDALESSIHPAVSELRAAFPDALENMSPEWREEIESFKRLIQDPGVKALFTDLGTPAQPPAVPVVEKPVERPVLVSANPYSRDAGEGWSLFFGYPDEEVAEIRYRLADDPDWSVAGSRGQASLGRLGPGRHRIEIEALDFAGERAGRYTLWLDPEREAILSSRDVLDATYNSWVDLRGYKDHDKDLFSYGHLAGHRDALQEVRYSFDDCDLDLRLPLANAGGRDYEWIPETVSYACVQLVYRDGVTTAPRRFYRDPEQIARLAQPPAAAAETPAAGPVTLSTSVSTSGWRLLFDLEPYRSLRAIHYRFADDPEWRSTGPDTRIDLVTGERLAKTWFVLEAHKLTLGRQRIDVKLTDWNGAESGPYTVWFDPEREILDKAKRDLREVDEGWDWARFDHDSGDTTLLWLSKIESHLEALREVRYSTDGCALDQRLPFRPWTYLGEDQGLDNAFVRLPRTVKSACFQLVFRDGEVTEPRQFFHD